MKCLTRYANIISSKRTSISIRDLSRSAAIALAQNGLLLMLPYLANMIVLFAVSPIADRLRNSGRISTTNVRKLFITLGVSAWLSLTLFVDEPNTRILQSILIVVSYLDL